jgi:hypothetical protein
VIGALHLVNTPDKSIKAEMVIGMRNRKYSTHSRYTSVRNDLNKLASFLYKARKTVHG